MRMTMVLAAVAALAGCGGNPFITGGGGGGGTPPITPVDSINGVSVPATVSGSMTSATFVPGDPTISVKMSSQDASDLNGTYQRDASFDVAGYTGYSHQETTSNRFVVALVKQVNGAKAIIAYDGGQFINSHKGGLYARADAFSAPTGGVQNSFNYSGSYVGLLNTGTPAPGGPGGAFDPTISYRTQGTVLITADFAEMTVSGGITNRQIVDTATPLPDQLMNVSSPMDANGNFAGVTKYSDNSVSGDYAGIFSGLNASEIATLYVFKPISGNPDLVEQGMFVGSNCAAVGGPGCP